MLYLVYFVCFAASLDHKLGTFELSNIPPAPRGVPQIEVTFDLDANGILNVTAADKSTGNTNRITITNDTGRLSKDQIDKMVQDAEKFREEDKKQQDKISAKNKLEQYAYQLRNTLNDEKVKDKIPAEEKEKLLQEVKKITEWMESNEHADIEEYEHKQKELESIANPIMSKLYAGSGGAEMPNMGGAAGAAAGGAAGPKVEEVD
jgi:heat shock protein 1/8